LPVSIATKTDEERAFLSSFGWTRSSVREKYSILQSAYRKNENKRDIGIGGARGQAGFTLIEILVAISILSISLVVVLQLFSGALKSSRVSDEYTRGIFYAQEKMDEVLLSDALRAGVQEGEFDKVYQWRVEIDRIEQTEEEAKKLPFDTFRIVVSVSWNEGTAGEGKRVQLISMKLLSKKEPAQIEAPTPRETKD